ncbi:MAG: SMR family transporter [Pseudomonadota bacterium]|nr:SMR family transporter [Pseudomonadota bacterium]
MLLKAGATASGPITSWLTMRHAAGSLIVHPAILGGLTCYVVSVVVWIVALSRIDVSIAYPMLSLGYVLNALLASWLFGEAVSLQRWLGIGVILLGVALVARSGLKV